MIEGLKITIEYYYIILGSFVRTTYNVKKDELLVFGKYNGGVFFIKIRVTFF